MTALPWLRKVHVEDNRERVVSTSRTGWSLCTAAGLREHYSGVHSAYIGDGGAGWRVPAR